MSKRSYKERASQDNITPNIITRDLKAIAERTGNLYESIAIASKRANQINIELKEELIGKLNEFASSTDNLEEVFENKEQIEISKFYERMPKPFTLALHELMTDNVYYRLPDEEK